METNILLANRLKELCEEKNLSYNALAEKSGLPVRRIYRMACGGTSNPGVFVMMQLCNGLGMSLDEFFATDEFKALRK